MQCTSTNSNPNEVQPYNIYSHRVQGTTLWKRKSLGVQTESSSSMCHAGSALPPDWADQLLADPVVWARNSLKAKETHFAGPSNWPVNLIQFSEYVLECCITSNLPVGLHTLPTRHNRMPPLPILAVKWLSKSPNSRKAKTREPLLQDIEVEQ